jgi:short-subunit dehydrogenase
VLGFVSAPYRGAYCASKFALEAIGDALRLELKDAGIHVALIEPGPIDTQFSSTSLKQFAAHVDMDRSPHRAAYERRLAQLRNGGPSVFRLGPEAVAAKVVHALESPRPRIRYRITIPSQGAAVLRRLLPTRLLDALVARW